MNGGTSRGVNSGGCVGEAAGELSSAGRSKRGAPDLIRKMLKRLGERSAGPLFHSPGGVYFEKCRSILSHC